MIHWLHPNAVLGATGDEQKPAGPSLTGRLASAAGWLWSALASPLALRVVLVLLLLWLVAVVSFHALRPGLADSAAGAGNLTYAWDMLHPAAGWALRLLLTTLSSILVVRAAQGALPTLAGLTRAAEPMTLSKDASIAHADAGTANAALDRLWSAIGAVDSQNDWAVSDGAARQALLLPPLGRRLVSQLRTMGLAISVVGCLFALGGAYNIVSPALLPGKAMPLPGINGVTVRLLEVQAGLSGAFGENVRATLSWAEQDHPPRPSILSNVGWRLSGSLWQRVTGVLPAVTVRVLDGSGAALSLQPVVGDRHAVPEYRGVLTGSDEQVLTVPDARIVLRIVPAPGELGSGAVVVEALDGGLGTSLGSLRSDQRSSMTINGVTVQANLEQACVISLWRVPGSSLLLFGLAIGLAGAILHRRYPVRRIWVGITQDDPASEWHALLATDPPGLAATIAERLGEPLLLHGR